MEQLKTGLYGKVPAHGDFIDRQLPVSFIRAWDDWLQSVIANSRERLGEDWLDHYLTSPIWRFMLSSGTLDEQSWAGVLVPSVDSVGRYFPLTIATPLPAASALLTFCEHNQDWFQTLEAIALAALHDNLNADQLGEQLQQTPRPIIGTTNIAQHRSVAVQSETLAGAFAAQIEAQLIPNNYDSHSLWVSVYSEPPLHNLLLTQGMPTADQYTALIDGQWRQWGWEVSA